MPPARTTISPRILHRLVLVSHPAKGILELMRESRGQDGGEQATYRASGAIVTTDDLGEWRFAYTRTSLEGVIAAGATVNEFVFPAGAVRFSAPGGRASLWNAPAVFERLTPGSGFSVVLVLKTGETVAERTFRFSAVEP